jgi:hypothetical protein
MSRWFRHYAGMMRDDKLVRVAIRSKQTIERVAWVWGAILESAAEIDDEGRYDVDAEEAAYFLRADVGDLEAILSALADAGRVADNCVVKWSNRQFQSDRSRDRVAAHRERKRSEMGGGNDLKNTGNDDVTLQSRHGNAPDTETELETEEAPPKPPRKRRGEGKHLLPKDWEVPPVADLPPKARGCAELWTAESYATHGEAFTLYWRSEGKMKTDWLATWANRVIDLHSKVLRDQKFGNAPKAAVLPAGPKRPANPTAYAKWCEQQADNYERIGQDHEAERLRKQAAQLRGTGPPKAIGDLIPKHLQHHGQA